MPDKIKFNVQGAFNYILDDSKSRYVRAVRFYQLQVAIATCMGTAPNDGTTPGFDIIVDKNMMRAARWLASMLLLRLANKRANGLNALMNDPEIRPLLRRTITRNGDLSRAVKIMRSKEFNKRILKVLHRCESVSAIARYSCCFDPAKAQPRLKGGRTAAARILSKATDPNFRVKHDEQSLRKFARRYEPVLAFFYFDQGGNSQLLPKPLMPREAARLLREIETNAALKAAIAGYDCVSRQLRLRNYTIPPLTLPDGLTGVPLTFPSLPDALYH